MSGNVFKSMDDRTLSQVLSACSSPRGSRCSNCPAFGHGDYKCTKHAIEEAARRLLHHYNKQHNN